MPYTLVYLAGINNSGPQHWQRLWHEAHGGLWIEHRDWDNPDATEWLSELALALAGQRGPIVFVAHSLGCLLAAAWLRQGGTAAAAYLVAPPDIDGQGFPFGPGGFGPAWTAPLSLPVRVVASQDDPYCDFPRAQQVAANWKASFWDYGAKGHINAASGLGSWEEGWQDFQAFLKGLPA